MRSTTGVCTGKVRSTPTPKLTLRTVKVSRIPPPWRRMTAPWKTWMRERLPSITRTCTLTVSPGRNWGMSARSESASRASRVFIAAILVLAVARTRSGQRVTQLPFRGAAAPARSAHQRAPAPAATLYCATSSADDARRPRPRPADQLRERHGEVAWGEGHCARGDLLDAPPAVWLLAEQLQLRAAARIDLVHDVAQHEERLARVDVDAAERADVPAQPHRALEGGRVGDQPDLLGQLADGG